MGGWGGSVLSVVDPSSDDDAVRWAQEPRGGRMYIGTNHSGVATFQNGRRTHHFRWVEISKLNYEGRMFIIHIIIMEVRSLISRRRVAR